MARVNADNRHLSRRRCIPEPDSQRSGFRADPFKIIGALGEPVGNRVRAGRNLGLRQNRVVLIHLNRAELWSEKQDHLWVSLAIALRAVV